MNILEHMKELGFDIAKAINYKDLIAGKKKYGIGTMICPLISLTANYVTSPRFGCRYIVSAHALDENGNRISGRGSSVIAYFKA